MARHPASGSSQPAPPGGLRPRFDTFRVWIVAASIAIAVAPGPPSGLGWLPRIIAGWDAALLVVLARSWRVMVRADAD
jgi:hypothetical protein